MRPTRLELVGFASFRERTHIDFDDADLFVLTGPTGAGKTSIVDGLVFALYGSVPRYDDLRAVAPVISQGKLEAKVRLDFELDGTAYTAVRVVRRQTSGGATTKEARLQRGEHVLASGAKELTETVASLLGLSFEHFTRCVVLPQGDFAEFLHATPGDRQELLVRLLDLDLYRDVGRRANQRAAQAARRVEVLDERLSEHYADATPERLEAARERCSALDELREHVDERTGQLDELREVVRREREVADKAEHRVETLESVDVPDGARQLAGELRSAREAATAAEGRAEDATVRLHETAAEREQLGDAETLREARRRLREVDELDARIERGTAACARAAAEVERVSAVHAAATDALDRARATRDELRRHHVAADLAAGLHAGDDCPVCLRQLDEDPDIAAAGDLEAADRAVADAKATVDKAVDGLEEARRTHTKYATRLEELTTRRESAGEQLDDTPAAEEIDRRLAAIEKSDEELVRVRKQARSADEARKQARERVIALEDDARKAWTDFDRVRDRIAALGLDPPPPDRDDLAGTWQSLLDWANGRAAEQRDVGKRAAAAADEAAAAVSRIQADVRDRCVELGVELDGREPHAAVAACLAVAQDDVERLETAIEEAGRLRAERKEADERRQVASTLGTHLRSNRFETWLLNRALRRLVVGATVILRDLSSGAYSLSLNDRNEFEVVDHLNADELRPAKTLSGGETFLASLALALALAEHLVDLAAAGTAKLDALFLDEGFGTLDPETLDIVAQAIGELGARGRMVGLITHVRDLAEQIPIRYEVTKTANTSHVEKVVR